MTFTVYAKGDLVGCFGELTAGLTDAYKHIPKNHQQPYQEIMGIIGSLPSIIRFTQGFVGHNLIKACSPEKMMGLIGKFPMKSVDPKKILANIAEIRQRIQQGQVSHSEIEFILVLASFLNTHCNSPSFKNHFIADLRDFIKPLWKFIDYFSKQAEFKLNGQDLSENFLVSEEQNFLKDLAVMHYAVMSVLSNHTLMRTNTTAQQKETIKQLLDSYKAKNPFKTFDLNIAIEFFAKRSGVNSAEILATTDAPIPTELPTIGDTRSSITPITAQYLPVTDYNWQELAAARPAGEPDVAEELNRIRAYHNLGINSEQFQQVNFTNALAETIPMSDEYQAALNALLEIQNINTRIATKEAEAAIVNAYKSKSLAAAPKADTSKSLKKLINDIDTATKNPKNKNFDRDMVAVLLAKTGSISILLDAKPFDLVKLHTACVDLQRFINSNLNNPFYVTRFIVDERVTLKELLDKKRISGTGLKKLMVLFKASNTIIQTNAANEEQRQAVTTELATLTANLNPAQITFNTTLANLEQKAQDAVPTMPREATVIEIPANNSNTANDNANQQGSTWVYLNYLLTAVSLLATSIAIILNLWILAAVAAAATMAGGRIVVQQYRARSNSQSSITPEPSADSPNADASRLDEVSALPSPASANNFESCKLMA